MWCIFQSEQPHVVSLGLLQVASRKAHPVLEYVEEELEDHMLQFHIQQIVDKEDGQV